MFALVTAYILKYDLTPDIFVVDYKVLLLIGFNFHIAFNYWFPTIEIFNKNLNFPYTGVSLY